MGVVFVFSLQRCRGAAVLLGCYLLYSFHMMTHFYDHVPPVTFFDAPVDRRSNSEADTPSLVRETKSTDHSTKRMCTRDEIREGSWEPVTLEKPPYISKTLHLRCYPLEAYKTGRWDTYDWVPSSPNCVLSKWSRSQFCSLMERATVMIVGDSLSWEHYSSMAQQLGVRVRQSSQHTSKLLSTNHVQLACQNKVRLAFRRDDRLTNLTGALQETHPQVLILNRGAHYVNDTSLEIGIRRLIDEVKVWKNKCQDLNMKCHLFWRTSVPGHPLCDKVRFDRPVNDLQAMEAWIADPSHYNNHTINYRWGDYQRQNELVIDLLDQNLPGEFEVIDAYYINLLRPDEHRSHQGDCLHNCYPGKVDVYSRLLFHFLKIQRTRHDVDTLVAMFEAAMARIGTSGRPTNSAK